MGIPSYDPKRILDIARYIWWTDSAPGTTVPQGLTSVPFQFLQSLLAGLGIPYVGIQAIFFWLIIFLMGYGMFLMGQTIFGKDKKGLAILAGLFYQFNPYMMIEVWHRFIHTTFFLAAFLPFLYIFWHKWIKSGLYRWLLVFLTLSFISSYMFGTLAFIVVILILFSFTAISEALLPFKNFSYFKKVSLRFLFGLAFWFLIQTWWMMPSLGIAPAVLSAQHSVTGSLSTLLSISEQTIIPYSLFGINPFYIYQQSDFGAIYNSAFFRLIPFLFLIFLFPGLIKSLMNKNLSAWGLLFVLGLFLSKGAASPFGYSFIFGFTNIFQLGVLRNPFEKLGILIPFSGAILFAIGVNYYSGKIKNKAFFPVLTLIVLLMFGVFQWPLWAGKLFGSVKKPAYIQVPETYTALDEYIKNKNKSGNILHLPLATGESATYYWQWGYNGVESSQLYFKSLPSVSRGFNIKHVDDAISALSAAFSQKVINDRQIIELLRSFNIRFIVLHKDMEWRGGTLDDPKSLEAILNSKAYLNKEENFGNLMLYSLNDNIFAPKLRFADSLIYISPGKENSYWPWLIKEQAGDLMTPINKQNNAEDWVNNSSQLIVLPDNLYSYSQKTIALNEAITYLSQVRILPTSPMFFLVTLKENLNLFSLNEIDKFTYKLSLSGKRLLESYYLKEKNKEADIEPYLLKYQLLIKGLENEIKGRKASGIQTPLSAIFARHLMVLDYLISSDGKTAEAAEKSKKILTGILKSANLLPYYELKQNNDLGSSDRLISVFEIPYEGKYEILMAAQNGSNFYKDDLLKLSFQVDDSLLSLKGVINEPFISYGYIDFKEGLHEISFFSAFSENMLQNAQFSKDLKLQSDKEPLNIDFEIDPVTGGGWYKLSFDSLIESGDDFKVQLIQDSDPFDESEDGRYMSFNKRYLKELGNTEFNHYEENLNIRPSTKNAKIRFLIASQKNSSSKVLFKDISLKRALRNPLFLRSQAHARNNPGDSVAFTKISPVTYQGNFSLKSPNYLIFAEAFHPGWVLKLNDGQKEISLTPQYLANLYSSAWYIEKGTYSFRLEFVPQDLLGKGIYISGASLLVILILSLKERFKK